MCHTACTHHGARHGIPFRTVPRGAAHARLSRAASYINQRGSGLQERDRHDFLASMLDVRW
jgi:hypothetical protein